MTFYLTFIPAMFLLGLGVLAVSGVFLHEIAGSLREGDRVGALSLGAAAVCTTALGGACLAVALVLTLDAITATL